MCSFLPFLLTLSSSLLVNGALFSQFPIVSTFALNPLHPTINLPSSFHLQHPLTFNITNNLLSNPFLTFVFPSFVSARPSPAVLLSSQCSFYSTSGPSVTQKLILHLPFPLTHSASTLSFFPPFLLSCPARRTKPGEQKTLTGAIPDYFIFSSFIHCPISHNVTIR